ncbi:MAG: dethiobiotin synthase [Pirellulales bacterium]|nr:dethiobiotin synthase [Pirellulales bacterium]
MTSAARGLFITGTDTDVGKTYVAARIARALYSAGRRVGVYKPVASGCQVVNGQLVSGDAVALWEAAGRPGVLEDVCPQRFAAPLAPHLAAEAEGGRIDDALIAHGFQTWRERSEMVIVEGAGGLFSPITRDRLNAQLAAEMGLPLVVVVANRLGAIHQALCLLLAVEAFNQRQSGAWPLTVAGLVLNQAGPTTDGSQKSNRAELARLASAPVLCEMNWNGEFSDPVDWWGLAGLNRSQ